MGINQNGVSGDIPAATAEDVEVAVVAARRAFRRNNWSATSGAHRATYLRAIAAKVMKLIPLIIIFLHNLVI